MAKANHHKNRPKLAQIATLQKSAMSHLPQKQAQSFLGGLSAPDFAPENYEVDFKGRATLDDLTDLGRAQMALA